MLDQSPISYRWVMVVAAVFFLIGGSIGIVQLLFQGRAVVVFCDVGQGDGVYIRTSSGSDIVIDAGPNGNMVSCLGKYMPFFDKTIEYAFLSHPQHDHYGGFLDILRSYHIQHLFRSSGDNDATSFIRFKGLLANARTQVHIIHAITRLDLDATSSILFLWPFKDYISSDLNDYSEIFIISLDSCRFLFTGDTSPTVLSIVQETYPGYFDNISVLKVPHHGSKNGLTYEFLKLADPTLSVISVAIKNRYHHPSSEVLGYFKALNKSYFLTSQFGDIEVTFDEVQLFVRGADGLSVQLPLRPP